MELLYKVFGYFSLLVSVITLIIAFTWQRRRAKWLFCAFLLLSTGGSLLFHVVNVMVSMDLLKWSSPLGQFVNVGGTLLFNVGGLFLLWFALASRRLGVFADSGPSDLSVSATTAPVDLSLVGIGGWLILPAIGLVLGGIASAIGLVTCIVMYSRVAEAGFGEYFALSTCVDIGLFVFLLVAAARFFGKKKSAPSLMIGLMVANMLSSLCLLVLALGMNAEELAVPPAKGLVGGIIGGAIWIPYFRVSKRVKATFVNP